MPLERAAVRRLRNGVVPSWELDRLSVGYSRAREIVSGAIDSLRSGRPETLFVTGEWGSGKSHFLSFVRAAADTRAVPCSVVSLNARTMPLNYPQRFYGPLVEGVRVAGCAGDCARCGDGRSGRGSRRSRRSSPSRGGGRSATARSP